MTIPMIDFAEGDAVCDWINLTDALADGHSRPKTEIDDTFLYRGDDTLLSRSAWIDGLGILVKSATVFPGNPAQGRPMVGGAVSVFSDQNGALEALLDFHLVTKWKTAGDSLLAARRLARPDSETILIVGAGTVGRSLHSAYQTVFPSAQFQIWNRSADGANRFAAVTGSKVAPDLETAVRGADIVTSATMTTLPLIDGAWLSPGTHLDLIGAYRPDMREANDRAMTCGRLFVDSRATTIGHIGEIKDPIERGVISADDIVADYYELDAFTRSPEDITVFKNGGGAHLDLMTSRFILDRWREAA